MSESDVSRLLARAILEEALEAQRNRDFERAIDLYTISLTMNESAEAFTYRGWARSFLGHYEEAIEDCLSAIEIDPNYGNPYNDIGAYLIELGRCEEAIDWLTKAIRAPRYEARCYPFMNLGRIYLRRGELLRALSFLENSLHINPRYSPARRAIDVVQRRLN